ncbi:MAG: hypothetical protein FWE14_07460 [Lachnospiraceae bacterium]|nr:hypothetical protein [Lachnospiraceae bacterium]
MNPNVKFINSNLKSFFDDIEENQNLICFGISKLLEYFSDKYKEYNEALKEMSAIADNNIDKQGGYYVYKNKQIPIISPQEISGFTNVIILIAVANYQTVLEICNQIQSLGLSTKVECYSLLLLMNHPYREINNFDAEKIIFSDVPPKIPKVIHSFWFSDEPKPFQYLKCIDSWKLKCPEYEIIEWNLHNYDISKSKYMLQAYEKRKWAFISDYARLDVVYEYGGIYLDMDVELLKSINAFLKINNFFCKDDRGFVDLGSGFGAIKKSKVISKLLKTYENKNFILDNGNIDIEPQPRFLVSFFQEMGMSPTLNSEIVNNEVLFLSNDYFKVALGNGSKQKWSGNEVAIHWHNGGWKEKEQTDEWKRNRGYLAELQNFFTQKE